MFKPRHPEYQCYRSLRGSLVLIEGIIGAGKTTLGKSLETYLNGIGLVAKFFPEYVNRPLLSQYILNMKRYAYSFQLFMLGRRIEIYREAERFSATGGIAIVDRSLPGDVAFARMQYQNGNFSTEEWDLYNEVINTENIPVPTACIFLECSPDTSLIRVQTRGIKAEISGYSLEYMTLLSKEYDIVRQTLENTCCVAVPWDIVQQLDNGQVITQVLRQILDQLLTQLEK